MQDIQLTLTLDETNVILEALGEQPYKSVFQLITKLQQQANEQLQTQQNTEHSTAAPAQTADDTTKHFEN